MVLLSGCGDDTPKCGDEATINLVAEISQTKDAIIRTWLSNKTVSDVNVVDIRTQEINKDIRMSTCAATLNVMDSKTNKIAFTFPITYTVQLADDNKNIYININGLP
jgi:hypothetical protein